MGLSCVSVKWANVLSVADPCRESELCLFYGRSSHSSQIDRGGRNCAVNAPPSAAMGKSETNAQMHEWKGIRVEADVANFPLLSLFRREENRDGNTCNFNTLHSY